MSSLNDVALLILRVTFGLGLSLLHGYPKIFGGRMAGFTKTVSETVGLPFPAFFAWSAALTELVGGLLIAVGLATRPAATLAGLTMMVALFRHRADPYSTMELAALYLAAFVLLALTGPGRLALDRFIRLRSPIAGSS